MSNPWKELRDALWDRAWNGGLTTTQLVVCLRLVEHFPDIWPGEQTLARWTRLGVSTVRQAVKELVAERILIVTRNPGRVNQYRFLDRDGAPITRGCPDIGPTPPAAGSPPRQQLDHTPPASGSPTPPAAGSEADPDLKQINKAGGERAREAPPILGGGVTRVFSLPNREPTKEYLDEALMRGVSLAQAKSTWEHYFGAGLPERGVERLVDWLCMRAKERANSQAKAGKAPKPTRKAEDVLREEKWR